jgi:hypothetical protein
MVTRGDYNAAAVQAAKSVMIEVVSILGEYRGDLAVVGGQAPEMLVPPGESPHVGSIDVDLALNHTHLRRPGYKRIQDLLLERGYERGEHFFQFTKRVKVGDEECAVNIDLLAGIDAGTDPLDSSQIIHDEALALKVRGCDLLFEVGPVEVAVEGTLPDGAGTTVRIPVAAPVPFLVMKGIALAGRYKEKDAYDVFYLVRNYPGGARALADEFRPHLGRNIVQEGLEYIANAFRSVDSTGPVWVAAFEETASTDERELLRRGAFEVVSEFLKHLGME